MRVLLVCEREWVSLVCVRAFRVIAEPVCVCVCVCVYGVHVCVVCACV